MEICLICGDSMPADSGLVCASCNAPERTINDIKREYEETSAL